MALTEALRDKKMRALETVHPVLAATGLRVLDLDSGYARVEMPHDVNANHLGTFYAGSLFILAEVVGAALFSGSFDSKRFAPIVKNMQIRYVRPALTDVLGEARLSNDEIDALRQRAETKGKADHALRCELADTAGNVVAIAECVFQLRSRSGPPS
jgi:acyl-coenzyme A thioesterase PaaI-like protein